MGSLIKLFNNLSITKAFISPAFLGTSLGVNHQIIRTFKFVDKPKPGLGKQYRRQVFFPKDGKYTIEPLDTKHLAGRDPVSGRKVAQGIGGGVKHK